jgi:ABC-type polysaccharide/polyol phosphate transport system ATPase subunit
MADDVVIRAEGLGKKYLIGHSAERERYVALRDVLARGARNLWRKTAGMACGRTIVAGDTVEEFWALRDVSFEVKRGEVLGIVGRNGAGKSTLLKILSRITEPSEGRVTIKGRVASLLEVGTGFHPELTGRENIYLNGAILGMTRAEIRKKFDEIVAFAEVEKFLDTPVKRYSSGMYVRLAFAVAAHLESELLLIDEVLAVGDHEFQKKCLRKMEGVREAGRTIVFVSHYLPAISSLCSTALMLDHGRIGYQGNVSNTLDVYFGHREIGEPVIGRHMEVRAALCRCKLDAGGAVSVRFDVTLRGPLKEPRIGIGINDGQGTRICTLFSETSRRIPDVPTGRKITLQIVTEPVRFSPGFLFVKVALAEYGEDLETHDDAIQLIVPDYDPFPKPPWQIPRGPLFVISRLTLDEEIFEGEIGEPFFVTC